MFLHLAAEQIYKTYTGHKDYTLIHGYCFHEACGTGPWTGRWCKSSPERHGGADYIASGSNPA
jgi:hypothetical protein